METRRNTTFANMLSVGVAIGLILAKATLVRLKAAPLRSDPCDAVGAFAVLTVLLIAAGTLVRRLRKVADDARLQAVYGLRSQQAVVLAAMGMVAGDLIALCRHPSLWLHSSRSVEIVMVLGSLAAAAIGTESLIIVQRRDLPELVPARLRWGALLAALAIISLVICPEWPIYSASETAHVLTVTLGALVLFVPMRILVVEFVPHRSGEGGQDGSHLSAVLTIGALLGAFGFWAETAKLGTAVRHISGPVLVLAVLTLAYASLATPLGFTFSRKQAA